ncbi:unnamed protein product [Medioppia subpectinata]|uniref:GST N-terminal domain-containing protein n=1 Tax=Medioppia subpectinata TaxID=1979941 RepID=A0A7R9Q1Y2_9ACAR|nr:unnamed protein product [Medioppia subpectinata]CAG2108886.1 unnamed protein product [Medioppia subpectinata]
MSELTANNYQKGDHFPARADPNILRVYYNQPCPFSERVRLVLTAKGIEHEKIAIKLRSKPEWFQSVNPSGKIPVIEFGADNRRLTESLVIADYLEAAFPDTRRLQPDDPYERANDRVFIEILLAAIFKIPFIYTVENLSENWSQIAATLKPVDILVAERRGNNKFLSGAGNVPNLVDYAVWPFIKAVPQIADIAGYDSDDYLRQELPAIHDYMGCMSSDPTVLQTEVIEDNECCVRRRHGFAKK